MVDKFNPNRLHARAETTSSAHALKQIVHSCAHEIKRLRRPCTAWHPVSEPPTEADGDQLGSVAVWWIEEELFGTMHYRVAPVSGPNLLWARIHDVVLLPSHDEGGSDE